MPDIAMCIGATCPDRYSCYRHTATSSGEDQSYGDFPTERVLGTACDGYWPKKIYPTNEVKRNEQNIHRADGHRDHR